MARNIIVIFLILVSCFYLQAFSSLAKNNLNTWCSQTPYREPCKHFMSHLKPKHKTEFQKWVIQIALNHTILTHGHIKELGTKCRNDREKGAWADCVTLYDSTISILNKTLDYSMKNHCTNFDKQIWLSTALTNLEVCQTGLTELGLDHDIDFMSYHMSNNVSMLISNSLAMHINKGTIENQSNKQVGFPTWVTRRDRKLLQNSKVVANLVVAQDGSGNYKTIGEALDVASKRARNGRFVIHIKKGLYKEYLEIGTNLKNIMLVGDGMQSTIITGSRSNGGGFTTFNSATVAVTGDGFIARGITFRNTAGPENHQAVALRVASDHSVFYQCSFEGYQDTLYTFSQRQFYKDSNIYGTIDFIFGNSASVFQNCNIILRKPLPSQKNTVTAQGRSDPNQNTGIIIQNCRIISSSELKTVSFRSYLGRPWKKYSRTIVMQSFVDNVIDSAGWLEWDGDFGIDTLFYGEYKNSGPGSSVNGRVKWGGFKIITSKNEASLFSVRNFIGGQSWLPNTGVPFTSDI